VESEAKYVFIGTAVIALALIAFGIGIWWSDNKQGEKASRYAIYFRQQSLAGVQVGSPVTMRGIKVGQVESFEILPSLEQGIRVVINARDNTPVLVSTKAVIERNLLTGLALIELKTEKGEESAARLDAREPGEAYPIIREGTTPWSKVADSTVDILENFDRTLHEAREFLTPENREHVSRILANAEEFTETLNAKSKQFKDFSGDIAGVLDELKKLAESAIQLVKTVERSMNQLVLTARVRAGQTAQSLDSVSEQVGRAADGLRDPQRLIFGPNEKQFCPGEKRPE
jgi:phospholipid/cholesterol/gamma-HCH transport system substrate-binding protein